MDLKKRYLNNTSTREEGLIVKNGESVYIAGEGGTTWDDTNIENNFLFLKKKLFDNERSIHYLDLYNITEYYTDINKNLAVLFGNLIENTAISIGVDGVVFLGTNYKRGDLLLKLNNGQPQKIAAPSSGMYVPTLTKKEGHYSLTWGYSQDDTPEKVETLIADAGTTVTTEEPISLIISITENNNVIDSTYYAFEDDIITFLTGSDISEGDSVVVTYYPAIVKELDTTWASDNNVYGLVLTTSKTFAQKTYIKDGDGNESIPIIPIIKFFNEENEEVYCDFILSTSGTNWAFTFPDTNGYIRKAVVK